MIIELRTSESVTIRLPDTGHEVTLSHEQDGDGNGYVRLGGANCNLEGEQPGMYYPAGGGS